MSEVGDLGSRGFGCGGSRFGGCRQGGSGAPKAAPCPLGGNLNDAGGCLYLMCGPGRLLAGTAFLAGGAAERGSEEDFALLKTRPRLLAKNAPTVPRAAGRVPHFAVAFVAGAGGGAGDVGL